jgi:hypothetical protein
MRPLSAEPKRPAAAETRSGLEAWKLDELPEPPRPKGRQWIRAVGPGVIVLGLSIGGGEFILGPAAFIRYGFSLLWVTLVAVFFQTLFNTEVMRYTVATGEPVFTGFMRTRPSSTAWAWFYTGLYFLQTGWPASAAVAAGAIFFLAARRVPTPSDADSVYYIGAGTFVLCVVALLGGRRIERTLELVNWVLVTCILGTFLLLAIAFAPLSAWIGAAGGLFGFDVAGQSFKFIPEGADFFLLAALVAYSGAGGLTNVTLANWARDKGYGMGERAGYIPGAIGGKKINLAHTGFTFTPTPDAMRRWRGWWRIVSADQWGVFFCGAVLGMILPALLYVTFVPAGTDIQGLGISAALANNIGARAGPLIAGVVAFLGAWLLFKTQLDILEGMVRSITDILWTGSGRVRRWRGGDVRAVYYTILLTIALWAMFALRLAQPIMLLKIAANVAGIVFVVASLHLLYINTRLLPPAVRPPLWRRVGLIGMSIFYAVFVVFSLRSIA